MLCDYAKPVPVPGIDPVEVNNEGLYHRSLLYGGDPYMTLDHRKGEIAKQLIQEVVRKTTEVPLCRVTDKPVSIRVDTIPGKLVAAYECDRCSA